jgi:hypothetical protein
MTSDSRFSKFWWQWVAANSIAELIGLGTVAAIGYLIASRAGEPHGLLQYLAIAASFVLLGAFEGLVVGLAQARVLLRQLPALQGWVRASVVGAIVAWALGMLPSTIIGLMSGTSGPPPEISEPLRLLLAAGLGMVAGPLLAFFQWRRLRLCLTQGAAWWLPANAVAWALGMPIIFVGAHMSAYTSNPALISLGVGLSLLAAGAIVGAVHGGALVLLLSAGAARGKAA